MALPPADPGYYWWVDPSTGEYFQLPDGTEPPPGSVPVGAPDEPITNRDEDGTVTTTPPGGPTQEQIEAAERGPNVEGRSVTPDQLKAAYDDAIARGVPKDWADEWLSRNPNDENRLWDVWQDELNPGGWDPSDGPQPGTGGTGGTGGGGGTRPVGLDPPGDLVLPGMNLPTYDFRQTLDVPTWGWDQTLNLPNWDWQGALDLPDWDWNETLDLPEWVEPEAFSYDEFEKPTLAEAQNEPGYQFALEQGQKAMEASASARGTLNTGGMLKDLIGYGQRMGETNYNNVFNRSLDTWGKNSQLALDTWAKNYGALQDSHKARTEEAQGEYDDRLENYTTGFTEARKKATDEYADALATYTTHHDYGTTEKTKEYAQALANYTSKFNADTTEKTTEYNNALKVYTDNYNAAYKKATDEYVPIKDAATKSYENAYNVWLQKWLTANRLEQDND